MSEFHQNRTTPVRTRPKLTARRILECWPLLVWIAMGVLAVWIYKGGVTFTRMNGAVDVYQENITPILEGRLKEIKVHRGQRVPPGTVVAVMDPAPYQLEMETLRRKIVSDRVKDIREYDLLVIKLDSDLREIETGIAEDEAVKRELHKIFDAITSSSKVTDPVLLRIMNSQTDSVRNQVDLAKAEGRLSYNDKHLGAITDAIKRATETRATLTKESELVTKMDMTTAEVAKSNLLRPEEQQEYIEIKTKIDHCQLIAAHGGVVDRVDKEINEYVKVGEGVLKIVGDPEQIICFLPQDQANQLQKGTKVWVTSTSEIGKDYESVVDEVSPRINNLTDATSPLPNQRVHGRDVIVKYPAGAMDGTKFLLLPGQTVIIQTEKPGAIPLLNRIFPNDDSNKVH
ncbi:MAG TPA: HlyD family efflux transporter periplasmic adaptor subunit [Verrucomicrobiales bacterium]|jgi:multidrug resistance efflux pump|nr:HlyD family efflux transporter periplasmic adaptor subunit [Verrucomicrobiales bacterium]